MGLRNNFDTIIVINKVDVKKVVDIVHQILLKRNFIVEDDEYLSCLILNEVLDDELLEENYDKVRRGLNTQESLDLLKNHKGGGSLMYKKKLSENDFNVMVTFKSLNNIEIEAIIFDANSYFSETKDINNIIIDINNSGLQVIGITQGLQMLNDLDQETEIENILNGKINEKYKYIID
ncbi:hypothetical protein SAMN06265171_10519 [Chryseobacterium rhizoplanae]|uniref:Uncharacterized protein n=1 Tax=Chryseobacterium rhizoplanae TaxID=1609531 RepID=A0A521DE20_9FLAO|nr:hypothetical protein [Chryseobacterium rhizoplanae]SMO69838.1 hypothetical protein SAMN06265171_10519 [Chryseobacterium rhizoplanae]